MATNHEPNTALKGFFFVCVCVSFLPLRSLHSKVCFHSRGVESQKMQERKVRILSEHKPAAKLVFCIDFS